MAGGRGVAEVADEAIYLAMSLRNAGNGIAVLHGWRFSPDRLVGGQSVRPQVSDFRRLTRDLYVPAGDTGFWQGAFRDADTAVFRAARDVIQARQPFTIDLLYGDYEGGQRVVTRFDLAPRESGDWLASAGRHWNLDRADPR